MSSSIQHWDIQKHEGVFFSFCFCLRIYLWCGQQVVVTVSEGFFQNPMGKVKTSGNTPKWMFFLFFRSSWMLLNKIGIDALKFRFAVCLWLECVECILVRLKLPSRDNRTSCFVLLLGINESQVQTVQEHTQNIIYFSFIRI